MRKQSVKDYFNVQAQDRDTKAIRYALAILLDCVNEAATCECEMPWSDMRCNCPINAADLVDAIVTEMERLEGRLEKAMGSEKKDAARE